MPLAAGLEEASELLTSAAIVLIGGLATSTLLTLVFVPAMYTIFDDLQVVIQRGFRKLSPAREYEPAEIEFLGQQPPPAPDLRDGHTGPGARPSRGARWSDSHRPRGRNMEPMAAGGEDDGNDSKQSCRTIQRVLPDDVPEEDKELTHVGPGTPCGEYLRRFWHPVGSPRSCRTYPGRSASWGRTSCSSGTERGRSAASSCTAPTGAPRWSSAPWSGSGIRCCYHGWLYGVDGRILDTPGEAGGQHLQGPLLPRRLPDPRVQGAGVRLHGPAGRAPGVSYPRHLRHARVPDGPQWGELNSLQLASAGREQHGPGPSRLPPPLRGGPGQARRAPAQRRSRAHHGALHRGGAAAVGG